MPRGAGVPECRTTTTTTTDDHCFREPEPLPEWRWGRSIAAAVHIHGEDRGYNTEPQSPSGVRVREINVCYDYNTYAWTRLILGGRAFSRTLLCRQSFK